MQLEDFNHAMLRAIYAFHLIFFVVIVQIVGVVLIPFGYLAVLIVRVRLIFYQCPGRQATDALLIRQANRSNELTKCLVSFFIFLLTGPIQLLIRSFIDSLTFMGDCWKEQPDDEFSANVPHSRIMLRE